MQPSATDTTSLRIALAPAATSSSSAAAATAHDTMSSPSAPGSASSPSLALSAADRRLFCTQHVDELKRMADDKRNASEDKKEELRQLVGIRYRVLIETADSILTMLSIVDDSTAKLRALHDSLPSLSLGSSGLTAPAPADNGMTQMQLLLLLRQYALSATSIWSSLDAHDYSGALQMVLRMRAVHAQISSVEHYPLDAQRAHPEVQRIVDHATAGNAAVPVLPSLSAFFEHHAAYHRDLPRLIASQAVTRLSRERSLSPQSYSDIFLALSLLLQSSSSPASENLGLELLDLFLSVRRAQIADLIASATEALSRFKAGPAQATPILVHVLSQILFLLQYTLTDVALLFASTSPALNPHAKLVSSTGAFQAQWKKTSVAERVKAFWTSSSASGVAGDASKAAATASAAVASVTVDAGRLAAKTATWLSSLQSFLSESLLSKLLPFLLPASKSGAGSSASSSASGCVSLQKLRDEILRVANFEDERSLLREGAKEEDEAEAARREKESHLGAALARRRDSISRAAEEESKKGGSAAESKSNAAAAEALTAAEQAKLPAMRRKKLMERWEESCTLLFGARSSSALTTSSSAAPSTVSSVASFAAPLSLFDTFFFAPLSSFTLRLIEGSFERLTLLDRMEEIMALSAAATVSGKTKDDAANGKVSTKDEQSSLGKNSSKSKAKGKQPSAEADSIDDEFGLSALRKSVLSPSLPSSSQHQNATPRTDLNGEREAAVQSIVVVFRRELRKLARECKAVLVCKYTAPSVPSASASSSSSSKREIVPILFPALGRYLLDDLTPQLTRKYNQLVDRCIDGLKKRLAQLERDVMGAMGDVALWRSDSTRALVHQSVFIGRVCAELRKQTKLMSLDSLLASNATSTPRGVASFSASAANPLYFSLTLTSKTAFRVWSRYLAASLAEDFALAFDAWVASMSALHRLGDKHAQSYFAQQASNRNTAAAAAAGGAPLGLLLPVHASPSIFQLLFQLHHDYYLLLGFRPHADILSWVLSDVVAALLAVWESKVFGSKDAEHAEQQQPALQQLSSQAMLQAMFDFQLMFAVLRLPTSNAGAGTAAGKTTGAAAAVDPSGDARARYAAIQSAFDSRCASDLDQIDWVSSRPSFHANVLAAIARSGMLFGLLCKSNPHPPVQPTGAAAGTSSATPAAAATGSFNFDASASGSAVTAASSATAASSVNLLPLAAPVPRILPVTASLYPSLIPTVSAPKLPSASSLVLTPCTSYTGAHSTGAHSSAASAASASAAAASAAAASAPASSASSVGLSLSSFGAQLNLSALGGQKAVAELGTSLLGKLSASSLWGGGGSAATTASSSGTSASGRK